LESGRKYASGTLELNDPPNQILCGSNALEWLRKAHALNLGFRPLSPALFALEKQKQFFLNLAESKSRFLSE
jgi:hypothetical protein